MPMLKRAPEASSAGATRPSPPQSERRLSSAGARGSEQTRTQQLVFVARALAMHPAVQERGDRGRRKLGQRELAASLGDFLGWTDDVLDEAVADEGQDIGRHVSVARQHVLKIGLV